MSMILALIVISFTSFRDWEFLHVATGSTNIALFREAEKPTGVRHVAHKCCSKTSPLAWMPPAGLVMPVGNV